MVRFTIPARGVWWGLILAAVGLTVAGGQATAGEAAPATLANAPATHKQTAIIEIEKANEQARLEDFCLAKDGRVLALVAILGPRAAVNPGAKAGATAVTVTVDGGVAAAIALEAVEIAPAAVAPGGAVSQGRHEVRVYDAAGQLATQWSLDFAAQAINVAPDGSVVVGGNGKVARFDATGKQLAAAESPQMEYLRTHRDEVRERAKEQLESQKALAEQQLAQFEKQLAEVQEANKKDPEAAKKRKEEAERQRQQQIEALKKRINAEKEAREAARKKAAAAKGEGGAAPSQEDDSTATVWGDLNLQLAIQQSTVVDQEAMLKQQIASYKQWADSISKRNLDDVVKETTASIGQTHSICAGDKETFIVCRSAGSYGFSVWRVDDKLAAAKEIIKDLSGCCGQMDVQCRDGELYVSENSRHRVVRYDRDGKKLGDFGKRDREGEGENFGGCCNPMNLCFTAAGTLYVAESNGAVKHFTKDGKYMGLVGLAKVQPGCKNSCVAVTPDDSRLYYIDIQKKKIIVLTKAPTTAAK